MFRIMKVIHIIGLVLFLGSIITFVVISSIIEGANLQSIAFGREIISKGTNYLTFTGIWLIVLSGIIMTYLRYNIKQPFVRIKTLIGMLVVINAYFFILPAVTTATSLTLQSLSKGYLLPEYVNAYMNESIFGGVNVLLIIIAVVSSVWKVDTKLISLPPEKPFHHQRVFN